jgi:hypothetical protein
LHVEGVTRTKYLRFQNLTDATSEVAGMYSSSGGGTNDLSIYASALSSTSSNIKFLTAPTNSATTTTLFLEGSSGNVGIGTNSPSAATPLTVYYSATSQFHVGGAQAGISNNVYYNGSAYTNRNTSAGGALLQLSTDGSFAMRRATSGSSPTLNYSMYIDGSGNVGIGTTSVDAKLHVEGATSGTNLLIDDGIGYGVYVSAQNSFNFSYGRNETSTGYINFRGYQDGNTQFRNLNIGNGKQGYIAFFDGVNKRVGIGTINPAAPLDVVSNSSAIGIDLRGRSSDNIGQLSFESNDSGTTYSQIQSRSTELLVKAVANIPMSFYTNNTERMRIDPSGVVIQRYYATDYYHLANSTFYEKRGGRVYGVGTFNLFTNGQSTTQSSGYVRVTAIYATPSGSAVWLYKISGNRTIHLIWSNTGGYSGSTPSVTWNSSILQVSNANSSVYYAVEVELINIGNTWSVSWGNFPGFI